MKTLYHNISKEENFYIIKRGQYIKLTDSEQRQSLNDLYRGSAQIRYLLLRHGKVIKTEDELFHDLHHALEV